MKIQFEEIKRIINKNKETLDCEVIEDKDFYDLQKKITNYLYYKEAELYSDGDFKLLEWLTELNI